MRFDGKISRSADDVIEIGKYLLLEICNLAALAADKMIVRFGFRLEAVESAAGVYFSHQTLIDEERQISVDGAEAEGWKFRFELIVQAGCSGMAVGRTQYFQQSRSLATVAVGFFRVFLFH